MNLRPAQPADVPQIQQLVDSIYREYGFYLILDEEPHLIDPVQFFRSRGGELWVIDEAARIMATCGLLLHADSGEIKVLYVHPERRRRGWARHLVENAMRAARAAGRREMFLWSDTRFTAAHALYRAMGFAQGGTRPMHDTFNSFEYEFRRPLDSK